MNRIRPGHADDLQECRREAFRLLARGVADRRSPFHTPTLATVGPDGAPSLRTVVLRAFDPTLRRLYVHTDARSAKAADIAAEPRVALHAYDAAARVQLRLSGRAVLHRGDAVADAAWSSSRAQSRVCYAIEPPPGTPIDAPLPGPDDASAGRDNFVVVAIGVETLEWLWLSVDGHRRARFDWTGHEPHATWLAP